MRLKILAALMLTAGPASAHGSLSVTPESFWQAWTFDPLVVPILLVAQWSYVRGALRLWAKAGRWRGISRGNAVSFTLGEIVLVVALISPLDQLGGTLLSAHMAQHALLVAVAPPLLLAGRPGAAFAWAIPRSWGKRSGWSEAWRFAARAGQALSRPMRAAVLHGLALWVWHAPGLFDAALANDWVHRIEHATFFGTALLFWRAILLARTGRHIGATLAASFATLMHGGLLGGLITMAPHPIYAWYHDHAELWGMSQIEDQQLAGLLMWVPMGGVYFAACLFLASRLFLTVASGSAPAWQDANRWLPSPQAESK